LLFFTQSLGVFTTDDKQKSFLSYIYLKFRQYNTSCEHEIILSYFEGIYTPDIFLLLQITRDQL